MVAGAGAGDEQHASFPLQVLGVGEVLLGLQDRFDTHFLDSPAWQRARSAATVH